MKNDKKIAIFFDCENISANHVPSIFDELANYGEVIIKQSFKDWSSSNNKSWSQELHEEFAIEPIQVFKSKSAKNSSDLRIQRAVLEIMNKKNIDIIVLVSSDSDFRDLAMSIRSDNFEAIGFGDLKTPKSLRNAYSIFIELPIKKELEKNKDSEIIELLKEAIINTKDEKDFCLVSEIGTYLKNKNSSNNPKNFGANTWGDIIKKYPDIFNSDHLDKNKSQLIVSLKN
uniref:NYN domain-containing protein n=1 Tax=Aliarcobacter sp. TaxID=2321116 RepID=UPI0040482559